MKTCFQSRSFGTAKRGRISASSLPPYAILNDKTLKDIRIALPKNKKQLLAIPGIGPAKIAQYAKDILMLVKSRKPVNKD